MIDKWLESIKSITDTGSTGKCPFCGSIEVNYKCSIIKEESRLGYMDIWCDNCKNAFHVSRMQVPDGLKTDGEIPQGLIY